MTDMVSIIEKKKQGQCLSAEEIAYWVHGVYQGTIPDYQSSALLMAIRLRGMKEDETASLTMEMTRTGEMADLSGIPGVKVDKHSTGGVGDLTSLVAVPLAAACGVPVAKMSGRALGHTGGTLDKLWSVPGLRTDLSMEQFKDQVKRIGCAIIGQTGELAPVDKVLYALRDVTATVDSLPLIVSSILSKKIAAGCDAILLDVKTGSGALMPTLEESVQLGREMVRIGKAAGRRVMAMVTDMDQPLGHNIGNALEIIEAAEILKGRDSGRACRLCLEVAARMVMLSFGTAHDTAYAQVQDVLKSGSGLKSSGRCSPRKAEMPTCWTTIRCCLRLMKSWMSAQKKTALSASSKRRSWGLLPKRWTQGVLQRTRRLTMLSALCCTSRLATQFRPGKCWPRFISTTEQSLGKQWRCCAAPLSYRTKSLQNAL